MQDESEKVIQDRIIEYLLLKQVVLLRINSVSRGKTKSVRRCGRHGENGVPDLVGCMKDGRFICVEVKKAGGKLSKDQESFLEQIRGTGGLGIVAFSLDDVIRAIGY